MIKVGIVDDHAVVRAGLKQFLGEQVDLRVTGEAPTAQERCSWRAAARSTCC